MRLMAAPDSLVKLPLQVALALSPKANTGVPLVELMMPAPVKFERTCERPLSCTTPPLAMDKEPSAFVARNCSVPLVTVLLAKVFALERVRIALLCRLNELLVMPD